MLNLPSTTVRSKYLKTLPIDAVFLDPRNGHKYQIVEKKLKNSFIKSANHYLKDDIEPINLEEIPQEMLKMDNPVKANINKIMKNRIIELEDKLRKLGQKLKKPLYEEIKEMLDDNWHEGKEFFYILNSGLVLPFRKSKYHTIEDALKSLDKVVNSLFKDKNRISLFMEKQYSIQSDLYRILTQEGSNSKVMLH